MPLLPVEHSFLGVGFDVITCRKRLALSCWLTISWLYIY